MTTPASQPFDQGIASQICARISMGETLKDILEGEGMPSGEVVWTWQNNNAPFRLAVARAREAQMKAWADEIVKLSREGRMDWAVLKDRNGKLFTDEDGNVRMQWMQQGIARAELQIRTMQWLMERLARHDFGVRPGEQASTDLRDMPLKDLFQQMIAAFEALGIPITEDQLRKVAEATGVGDA